LKFSVARDVVFGFELRYFLDIHVCDTSLETTRSGTIGSDAIPGET